MKFISTADPCKEVSAGEAIILNISNDGGVFVPSSFPILDADSLSDLIAMDYAERTAKILSLFIDELTFEELLECAENAYEKFDECCPIVKVEDGLYMLEMWHGPSHSHKDVWAVLCPFILKKLYAKRSKNKKLMTALAVGDDISLVKAFEDVKDAKAVAFYSEQQFSDIRKKQLFSSECTQIRPVAVSANFAEINAELKRIVNDRELCDQINDCDICNINEFNILSVLGSTACFVSAYCDFAESGECETGQKINFAASDIHDCLSLYYGYRMGLPINKIVLATNVNNSLVDLINSGKFDVNREFYHTVSPALDVLKNENLERFAFEISGRDGNAVSKAFSEFKKSGVFELGTIITDIFEAGWADEEETKDAVFTFFDLDDYIMDTNTAVAASVYNDYSCDTDDETPTIILSVFSPYLYSRQVLASLGSKERDENKAIIKLQNVTALECPWELISEQTPSDSENIAIENMKDIFIQTALQ